MVLFVLAETAAGLALLKAKDKKLLKRDDLAEELSSTEGVTNLLKLKQFKKFESAVSAVEEAASLIEGKVSPMLSSLLDSIKDEKKASLAVADPKLGNAINKLPQLSLQPISDSTTADLYRAIRENLTSLIPGLMPQDLSTMSLGLSHSLSRHKLKFSPDKVDTMIVHAIALLDDLDKELNTYAMRVKEWYGWHFPEMGKIINDNLAYSRVILKMGLRSNAVNSDLAEILPEDIETAVKAAAEISMGTEITTEDLDNIQGLATEVVELTEYRQQLSNYLTARMTAIAPNLTALVGELVGARLIAHAGSLINLAKSPASTIQILGAEKALFRALKTKHDTPKYGLIYHASLIGQATGKNKGKIARMLATKAAIGLRVDALSEWGAGGEGMAVEPTEEEKAALGHESRIKIERRLRGLEGKPLLPKGVAVGPSGLKVTPGKWEIKEARKYNPDADGLGGDEPAAASKPIQESAKKSKKDKEGDVKMIEEEDEAEESDESEEEEDEEEEPAEAAEEVDEDEDEEDEEEEEEEEEESESESEAESPVVNGTSPTKEPEAPATEALSKKEKKRLKKERQGKTEGAETHRLAAQAGMSVVRFSRKLKRGEIRVVDGKPIVMTKKEMKAAKKARKAEKKHAKLAAKRGAKSYSDRGRKRKLEDDVAEKPAKKKNKAKYNKNKE